jgi:hypothetical protein
MIHVTFNALGVTSIALGLYVTIQANQAPHMSADKQHRSAVNEPS